MKSCQPGKKEFRNKDHFNIKLFFAGWQADRLPGFHFKKPPMTERCTSVSSVIGILPTLFFNCSSSWPRQAGHFLLVSPG